MNNDVWQQIGEDIKRQVQEAIDAGDFSRLSKTIGDTVGQTFDDMGRSFSNVANGMGQSFSDAVGGVGKNINDVLDEVGRSLNSAAGSMGRGMDGAAGNMGNGMNGAAGNAGAGFAVSGQGGEGGGRREIRRMKPNLRPDRRFFAKPGGSAFGIVCMALGFSLCGIAGFFTFITLLLALFGGGPFIDVLLYAGFSMAGLALGFRGITLKDRVKRFKRYVSMVQQKLYCSIEELARKTGRNKRYVLKDIKKMMQKGWFLQAHLDKQESCLIVSDEMYEQYRLTQENFEQQQKMQAQTKPETAGNGNAADDDRHQTEYRKMLEEGENYVRMIRICNDEIPGEEMSGKLDKLELLVTRIFDQVEKEPELVPDLHKMLNYYLPTTQKLLEAYRDLDKQNLDLQNISSTKREIEDTVDTINQAFEKFLDELFREKAWDIQSDISVLHTMLKQDGYLNGDFEKK